MTAAAGWLTTEQEGDRIVVAAGGAWSVAAMAEFDSRLADLEVGDVRTVSFDMGAVESLDTAAAWVLHHTIKQLREDGLVVEIAGASPAHAGLLERIAESDAEQELERPEPGPVAAMVERVGQGADWSTRSAPTVRLKRSARSYPPLSRNLTRSTRRVTELATRY